MSRKDDGGQAIMREGMTLRDWFAGQAPPPPKWWLEQYPESHIDAPDLSAAAKHLAAWHYAYADAMLEARKQ